MNRIRSMIAIVILATILLVEAFFPLRNYVSASAQQSIEEKGKEVLGTDRGDLLYGTSDNDLLQGLDGNDLLVGRGGHDQLDGGRDEDLLKGGEGDDTYVLDIGDGADIISDSGGADDELIFKGRDQKNVFFATEESYGLRLTWQDNGDSVLIKRSENGDCPIESFSLGSVTLTKGDIEARIQGNHRPRSPETLPRAIALVGSQFAYEIPTEKFVDPDVDDVLRFSIEPSDVADLPYWFKIDFDKMRLVGTPTKDDIGEITVRVIATDSEYVDAVSKLTIKVQDH